MDLDRRPPPAPRVGQRASRSRLVSRRDVALLAEVAGDRDPRGSHSPSEHAGDRREITAGGIASALVHAVLAEDLPGPDAVLLHLDLRFRADVRPADVITGTVRVAALRPGSIVDLGVLVTRDDGVVAVEGTAVCRTGGPGAAPAP